jgi:hypothetical protein
MKLLGWRFFYKNRRLELYFLETGAYLYFLFFYFFLFFFRYRKFFFSVFKKVISRSGGIGKCIVFLFAFRGVSDCVCEKVDAIDFNQIRYFILIKVVLRTCLASAFSQMQLLGILWQMKKRYSCWSFDFV